MGPKAPRPVLRSHLLFDRVSGSLSTTNKEPYMRISSPSRLGRVAVLTTVLSACFFSAQAQSPTPSLRLVSETPSPSTPSSTPAVTAQELHDIAVDAYIYAYPMVLMELTRRHATNVQSPVEGRAPVNQFGHRTTFPEAKSASMAWPSADALYSSLWYDVARQPLVIRIPESGGRYYAISLLDMWSDVFASRGSRTAGSGPQTFAIVGPTWQGALPPGIEMLRSPTASGWLIAQVQTRSPAEYAEVNQFQANMSATPLTPVSLSYTTSSVSNAALNTQEPPIEQLARMDAATYFTLFANLLRTNPPHANDYPILERMRRIGLGTPSFASFAFNRLDPRVQQVLAEAAPEAGRRIADNVNRLGMVSNGWRMMLHGIGTYGADYPRRAAVAYLGLGASTPEDVIYPVTYSDAKGRSLEGSYKYVLHFDKAQLPPTNAYWSLVLYDAHQRFAQNDVNRYSLTSTDALKYNADGSLDIYIQRRSPGDDKAANWLPTPKDGGFVLNMRVYWPKALALDGLWAPPPVRRR